MSVGILKKKNKTMKKKLKEYHIVWEETHSVIVEAKNKEEAIEKANRGETISDETSEVSSGFDAVEIK